MIAMHWESEARQRGFQCIAGVDEAGRGPLAGPVVAAACVIPEGLVIDGVNDSKLLSPSERFRIFQHVTSLAEVDFGIGIVDALIIDQINILQATFQAMTIAISRLAKRPDYLLVDGNKIPQTDIPGQAIVKGDRLSQSIGLASIMAKVTRDHIMTDYHKTYPQYGFIDHKGYGTPEHLMALEQHGPCAIHRKSFEPIKSRFFS